MSWAIQLLIVTMKKPCDAVELQQQWGGLDTWCGLALCCHPAQRRANKLLGFFYEGAFNPFDLTEKVVEVKTGAFISNDHQPRFSWPEDQPDNPDLICSVKFKRNGHANGQVHT